MTKQLLAILAVAATCAIGVNQASAATAADCRANWESMKTAGTTPAGVKYNQYIHDCVAGSAPAAAATPPAAPAKPASAPAAAPAAKAASSAPAAAPPTAMPTATPSGACKVQYDLASMMGKIPAGQSREAFLAACMAKASTAPATATTTTATKTTAPVPAEPTAVGGQSGEVSRIQACAKEWHQMKDTNQVPAGTKWPQFWSECDKQLKAQGL